MKQLSTARDTQRDPFHYIMKRRGRREVEVTRRRIRRIKREREIKPVIKSLIALHSQGLPER